MRVPKLAYIYDTKAFRIFDWYINDITIIISLFLIFLPLLLGLKIDVTIYWKNRLDFIINITNRLFFGLILMLNFGTVLFDYMFIDKFDNVIFCPKFFLLVVVFSINLYLFTKEE